MKEKHRLRSWCRSRPRWQWVCAIAGIIASVLFIIAAMQIGFLGDDWRYPYEIDLAAQHGGYWAYVVRPLGTAFAWRPFIELTWLVDYTLFGTHETLYHIPNILAFFGTLIMLYVVVRRLMNARIAAITTLFFALFPTHYEAIIWVTGRTDLYALFFCLLSWWLYLLWKERGNWWYAALGCAVYLIALFSKEFSIMLPAAIVAGDLLLQPSLRAWIPYLRRAWPLYVGLAAISLLYLVLRSWVLGSLVATDMNVADDFQFIPAWQDIVSFVRVALRIFSVHGLEAVFGSAAPWAWKGYLAIGAGTLVSIIALQYTNRKNTQLWKYIAFGSVLVALFLFPHLHLVKHITADLKHARLLYSASLGLLLLLATGLWYSATAEHVQQWKKRLRLGVTIVLCCVFTVGLVTNYIPLRQADALTNEVIHQFAQTFPDAVTTTEPLDVYIKNIPGEIHGAYVFHDYYSFRQAVRMRFQNPNLTIHSLDVLDPPSNDFCDPTPLATPRVGQWRKGVFLDRNDLVEAWAQPTTPKPLRWDAATLAGWKTQDLTIRREGDELILSSFGQNPRLYTAVKKERAGSTFRTLTIEGANMSQPLYVEWSFSKQLNPRQWFATESVDPLVRTEQLCRFPAWVGAENINAFGLRFPAFHSEEIRLRGIILE